MRFQKTKDLKIILEQCYKNIHKGTEETVIGQVTILLILEKVFDLSSTGDHRQPNAAQRSPIPHLPCRCQCGAQFLQCSLRKMESRHSLGSPAEPPRSERNRGVFLGEPGRTLSCTASPCSRTWEREGGKELFELLFARWTTKKKKRL